eukprot:1320624-Rhodomonas_salina.2
MTPKKSVRQFATSEKIWSVISWYQNRLRQYYELVPLRQYYQIALRQYYQLVSESVSNTSQYESAPRQYYQLVPACPS